MLEKFIPGKPEKAAKESESKEFTEEELFKIALKHIDSMANFGSSSNKANTGKLVREELAGHKESFIEESIKKAREMVASGEAERIAKLEYKGGIEAPKKYDELEDEED
jgi:hypothetical protein